jgi:hypothetical protein
MRAQLKELFSSDISDLLHYQPPDPEVFCIAITALVGPAGEEGCESFDIRVCTPQWFLVHYTKNEILVIRHTLLVFEYNYEKIYNRIKHEVEICTGNNWKEVASKVGRIGYWEFEDYEEFS